VAILNFGTLKGMAYKHDYQRQLENELRIMQMNRQQDMYNQQQSMLMADKFRFGKANNKYDQQRLDEYNKTLMNEVKGYMAANVSRKGDPSYWMDLQSYGDKFLNNSIITDALMYDKQMEMAQEAIKKDPSLTTSEEYKRFIQDAHNYSEYGDADGDTDKAAKGVGRKLLWAAPDNSDTLKDISEFAKTIGTVEKYYPDFYSKGAGAIVTEVPDEYLERAANSYYNSNRKAKLDMAFGALTAGEKSLYKNNPMVWVKSRIKQSRNQVAEQIKGASADGSGSSGGGSSAMSPDMYYYKRDVSDAKNNSIYTLNNTEALSPVSDKSYTPTNDGMVIPMATKDGDVEWTVINALDGVRLDDVVTTKQFAKGANGETFVGVSARGIPLGDVVDQLLDKGVLEDKTWLFRRDRENELAEDIEVADGYKRYFNFDKDAAGKRTGTISINAYVPALSNAAAIDAYQKAIAGVDRMSKSPSTANDVAIMKQFDDYPNGTKIPNDRGEMMIKENGVWKKMQ